MLVMMPNMNTPSYVMFQRESPCKVRRKNRQTTKAPVVHADQRKRSRQWSRVCTTEEKSPQIWTGDEETDAVKYFGTCT